MEEFGESLTWTYIMGGLARDYTAGSAHERPYPGGWAGLGGEAGSYPRLVAHWLDVADEGRMPIDPRLWIEAPIRSTYPACMAVKAAAEQSGDGGYAYLRTLREGLLCGRRKLDTTEALVEEARRVRLDVGRFRVDLASNAIVEAFGRDLEETRDVPDEAHAHGEAKSSNGRERLPFPTMAFSGRDGRFHWVVGTRPYEEYRAAAEAAGAVPGERPPPSVIDALRRFGRMAAAEVEAVCELATPPAAVELWRLASEWRAKPVRVLTGYLWEPA